MWHFWNFSFIRSREREVSEAAVLAYSGLQHRLRLLAKRVVLFSILRWPPPGLVSVCLARSKALGIIYPLMTGDLWDLFSSGFTLIIMKDRNRIIFSLEGLLWKTWNFRFGTLRSSSKWLSRWKNQRESTEDTNPIVVGEARVKSSLSKRRRCFSSSAKVLLFHGCSTLVFHSQKCSSRSSSSSPAAPKLDPPFVASFSNAFLPWNNAARQPIQWRLSLCAVATQESGG